MAKARAVDRRLFLLTEIAARRLNRAADLRLKSEAGISAAQAAVLFLLLRRGERRMGAISEVLSLNPPAVTGLVDRMVKAGLVGKKTDPGDRRGAVVALTAKGRKAGLAADTILKDMNAALEEKLGEDAADSLHDALTLIATTDIET
ncbi:MarR family winged helix-turn-helix transcriptional regulator [Hyphobacterium marinum]|uniref:MarR family winged helix-turn-helix transcriptional regulator n=1 Tax=Hyphobacterium marinum TaxID=3116574 RepID=A0ABU7LWR2_9PROT|nr:MarR family winged helix-turn-helix transcriptional regulator [Hyphobacterium sp. Y6023]MEE2565993.1 MarR family winged helix-turn-helix transcriptional regulator [Hyphobacterium sp. Y6023]